MIVAIVGPTGVGKTKLSIALAKRYNGIIVNNDAMQVYKDLNIGTAKPTIEERENIPHELLDFVDVRDDYSVYNYQLDARRVIRENSDKTLIFVGGSGLYLKAALYDYEFSEENSSNSFDGLSNDELYEMALKYDKNLNIHKNNRQRLIRYLNKSKKDVKTAKKLYDVIYIGLTTSRENLYERINKRVDDMISSGLVEEVKSFYDKKIYSKSILTAIGYKELYEYFDSKITLEEAIDLIKKRSRHYAKRQYTWFNNQMDIKWFNTNYEDFNKTIDEVVDYIEKSSK